MEELNARIVFEIFLTCNEIETEALEEKEEEDQMNAGWSVLLKYFEACGGYLVMFTIFFVVFLFALGTIHILRNHFRGMGVQKLHFPCF